MGKVGWENKRSARRPSQLSRRDHSGSCQGGDKGKVAAVCPLKDGACLEVLVGEHSSLYTLD